MPNHISEEAWKAVYKESLQLINAYPFMDKIVDEVTYDESWIYVDRVKERVLRSSSENPLKGWHIFGDLESMMTAESVELFKNLEYYRHNYREGAGYDDILAEKVFFEIDSNWKKYERRTFDNVRVFDGKTQGYPHHLYLLAIACLIESRFPKHAVVYGDLSIGQMESAVEWANSILDKPIQVTERTDNNKLLSRIRRIIDDEMDILKAFIGLTFHDKNMRLGEFVREHFSMETITAYYTERFKRHKPEQLGFQIDLREFIDQGYSLAKACDICVLDSDGCNYDVDDFIETVLSMQWRTEEEIPRKDLPVYKDAGSEEPDTVHSQFGHVFLHMAGIQESVKSTMTYDEVAAVLEEKLGRTVEVEDKLKEEEEVDEAVKALMESLGIDEDLMEEEETVTYDINTFDDLMFWKSGDTMHPNIKENLSKAKSFYERMMEEEKEYFAMFQSADEKERIKFLIRCNRYFYIRKSAWDQIINNIHDRELSNANFFALSVKAEELSTNEFYKALVNNQLLLKDYLIKVK